MWLPNKVYESLPQAWLLLGLLFLLASVYLGFDYRYTKYYFVTGVFCCLLSLVVFTLRLRNRPSSQDRQTNA
jgi:hypothetical protein